tara:strand:+ start:225 stop:599 length:375 start_codon:yes stop_codon:yes gene_type:complete
MLGAANPVGIGDTLNYIGNRVYGYSGVLDTNAGQEMLKFETGSELIVAIVQCFNTQNNSTIIDWEIFINSQQISGYSSEGRGSAEREHGTQVPIVIPPFTKVIVKGTSSSSINGAAIITGKIVG